MTSAPDWGDHLDDETTAFGEEPVDGIVFVPPSESPELRLGSVYEQVAPQHGRAPGTSVRRRDMGPVAPWTPRTPAAEGQPHTGGSEQGWADRLAGPARIFARIALLALPLLALLWLVRLGQSLVHG